MDFRYCLNRASECIDELQQTVVRDPEEINKKIILAIQMLNMMKVKLKTTYKEPNFDEENKGVLI